MKMGYSETTKIFSKPWIWAAAILGIIEALAWTVLSIIAICYYHGAFDYNDTSSTYSYWIYIIFLDHTISIADAVVTQRTFNFFMFIYMVLSVIWLGISTYLAWAMIRNKWNGLMNGVAGWAILTLLISVLDIILMGMIASDLATYRNSGDAVEIPTTTLETVEEVNASSRILNQNLRVWESLIASLNLDFVDHTSTIISTTYGIVMTLAARGYILWIANVVIAVIMIVIAIKMNKEDRPSLLPFIDAYGTESRPPFDLSKGNVNDSYENDEVFEIPSWLNNNRQNNNPLANGNNYSKPPLKNQNNTNNATENFMFSRPIEEPDRNQPQYERVAKIGKGNQGGPRGQNVPPPNVPQLHRGRNEPFIPDPDYTPPGSPTRHHQPKSVLRPRSNYVL